MFLLCAGHALGNAHLGHRTVTLAVLDDAADHQQRNEQQQDQPAGAARSFTSGRLGSGGLRCVLRDGDAAQRCRQQAGEVPLSLEQMVADGMVEYIDFPDALKGKYQSYTCADISLLREAGYDEPFLTVAEGVARYAEKVL